MPFRFPCLLGLLLLTACAAVPDLDSTANGARQKTDFEKTANLIFTPAGWPRALPADLYVPKGTGPWPAVLVVYGGSWSHDDHRWEMSRIAHRLAGRGFAVLNVSYRGTPEFRYPAPVDDLREALRWLRAHAAEHRLDPAHIGAYGFSAGGHLVELLGTLDGPPEVRLQAVVAASAPADLTLFPGGKILPLFLGTTLDQNPELFREASPLTHVSPDDPPFFLYHGTADKTVPPEHTRRFDAALTRAGVRHEVRWIEGRGHGTMLLFNGAAEDAAIDFLERELKGK